MSFLGTKGILSVGSSGDFNPITQFIIQLKGVGVIVLWTIVFTWIAIKITSLITSLRVNDEDESEGLDLIEHNETGYSN